MVKKGRCQRNIKGKTAEGKEEGLKAVPQQRNLKKKKKEGTGAESDWGPSNPATECNSMQQWEPDGSPWELSATALVSWQGWACVLKELAAFVCPKQWVGQSCPCLAGTLKTYCVCGDNFNDRLCTMNGYLCGTQCANKSLPWDHKDWTPGVSAHFYLPEQHMQGERGSWLTVLGNTFFYIKRKLLFSHHDNLHKEIANVLTDNPWLGCLSLQRPQSLSLIKLCYWDFFTRI